MINFTILFLVLYNTLGFTVGFTDSFLDVTKNSCTVKRTRLYKIVSPGHKIGCITGEFLGKTDE